MTRAAVYTRLSKNRNGEKSATLEYQRTRGIEIAEAEGWQVVDVHTDSDISGTKTNRAGYRALKDAILEGTVEAVVTQAMDRPGRNARERLDFMDLCRAHSVAIRTWQGTIDIKTASGELTEGIQASVDQWYARTIAEKVKDAHQRRLRDGRPNGGGRLYGEASSAERKVVAHMADMILEGRSIKSVARWLNQEGIETTRGNPWTSKTVKGLLTNPRLKGVLRYKGEEVGMIGGFEPILDAATFDRLGLILTNGPARPRVGRPTLLLSSVLRCSSCGGRMRGGKGREPYYRCSPDWPCERRMVVTAHHADAVVLREVMARVEEAPQPDGDALAEVAAQLAEVEAKRLALTEDYASGILDRKHMQAGHRLLQRQEDDLRASVRPPVPTLSDLPILDLLNALGGEVSPLAKAAIEESYETSKALIQSMVEKVVVHPTSQHASKGFDPNRLQIVWRG